MSMNPRRVRVLCLHGLGSNSDVLEAQTATLRSSLGDHYAFDFIDGAYHWPASDQVARIFGHNQVYYSYTNGTAASVMHAVKDLAQYATENGPFDAVLGFSLGAALAMTLLLNQSHVGLVSPPFRSAILLSGVLPCNWKSLENGHVNLLLPSEISHPVQIPTIHFWSPEDVEYPGQSQQLASMCDPTKRVDLVHHAGHSLPAAGAEMHALIQAIKAMIDQFS